MDVLKANANRKEVLFKVSTAIMDDVEEWCMQKPYKDLLLDSDISLGSMAEHQVLP